MSPERKTAFFSLTVNRFLYSNSSGPLLTSSAFFLETGGGGNGGEMRYKDQKQQICTKVLWENIALCYFYSVRKGTCISSYGCVCVYFLFWNNFRLLEKLQK